MPRKLPQLAFGYPRRGLSGEFNTFRLGVSALKDCQPGRVVELVDARSKKVLGRARVQYAVVGQLLEMAQIHANNAHNWKDHTPYQERAAKLIESLTKRYPPGRVHHDSVVTVIYMQEVTEP